MSNSTNRLTGKRAVQIVQSRTSVPRPGRYDLMVTSTPTHYKDKVIINIKGATPKMTEKAMQHLRDAEYDAAANCQLSFSPFAESAFIPNKGETVNCQVDYVQNKDGEDILVITSMSAIAAERTAKVSIGDEFANLLAEEDEVVATENLDEPG